MIELSGDEVRRLQLRAQGLLGAEGRRGDVAGLLGRLGAVQLDTISVLARSHELVPYARLGPVGRAAVENAFWGVPAQTVAGPAAGRSGAVKSGGGPATRRSRAGGNGPGSGAGKIGAGPAAGAGAFEYWAHAACVLPMGEWPYLEFRRRAFRKRGWRWHRLPEADVGRLTASILDRLRAEGPLTTKELGGAKSGGEWFEWSEHKIAVEWLLDLGEVVCVRRTGWRRVYDLPERAVPAALLAMEPDDATCLTRLVAHAGRALGVATRADLADYYRVRGDQVDAVLEGTGLVPVRVEGWRQAAWADPGALAEPVRGRHVTTLLSPFDSLVWDRKRTSRVFGFDHRLEAYVPRDKRVHGYFTMPLLAGGRLIGRVDPARENGALVVRRASFEPWATSTPARTEKSIAALRTALWQAAGWVGLDDVRLDEFRPSELAASVHRSLPLTLADLR